MIIKFDFDASLVSFVKAENSAFQLSVPAGSVGTNFAATSLVTLAPSGGGGCVNYTSFGSGRICSAGFNLNGLQGTREGDNFRITAVP